jgi:hypothetical protein
MKKIELLEVSQMASKLEIERLKKDMEAMRLELDVLHRQHSVIKSIASDAKNATAKIANDLKIPIRL